MTVAGSHQRQAGEGVVRANGQFIDDTSAHSASDSALNAGGKWRGLFAHEDTVIAALASDTIRGTLAGMLLPAGAYLPGIFTSITLTSGSVTAFDL